MGDKLLLLILVLLFTVVKSQAPSAFLSDEAISNFGSPKSTSDDLQSSDSTIRFVVMSPKEETNEKPGNGVTVADSDEDDDDDPDGLKMIESILDDDDNIFGNAFNENNTEEGDSATAKLAPGGTEEPIIASNSDDVETISEAPRFNQQSFASDRFDESQEERENGRSPQNNRFRNEPNRENSPLLQLTQGGYQRPFLAVDRFRDQRQSLRSESAPQQAEAVQSPNSNENSGRARLRQQSPYSSIFQPPFTFQPGPVFRQPFTQQSVNFANANGRIPSDIQNSFYNTQPDFSQGQYSQLDNVGNFPTVFSLQTDQRNPFANPDYLFQAPFQIPVSQSAPAHATEQIPQFFQQEASPSYPNYGISMNPAGSGFPALFGNPQANTQYQGSPNLYGDPNLRGNIFANPALGFTPSYPNSEERAQIPPQFINQRQRLRISAQNNVRPEQLPNSTPSENEEKQSELLTETPNKENPVSVPFGARIQRQNSGEEPNNFERQDNVYMRYPIAEAGYATEESLPTKNVTDKESKENVIPLRQPFPFFSDPRGYNVYNSPDPYRAALESVQRGYPNVRVEGNENQNGTEGSKPEQFAQGLPITANQGRPEVPPQFFRTYPERNPGLGIPDASFYPIQGVSPNRNPFEPIAIFPENQFQFVPRPGGEQPTPTPVCAKTTNDSICFEDPEYPRGEILYALNSDSYLMQRLTMPDQQLDKIPLIDLNSTEGDPKEENYICQSDIKYGLPLRAQNTKGNWKVIINMERTNGRGSYKQPVRMETCRGMGDPCTSVTEIKTACVQKYSLQRLLSWSVEKGVHYDVFKLPVACSCQILEPKA